MKDGDRRIRREEIPQFLRSYQSQGLDDLAFFEKVTQGVRVYEVKYEEKKDGKEREVSIKYSEQGDLIEREEDIDLENLPLELRQKILVHIGSEYPGAKIHELEWRTVKDQKKFLDVEIRHKSSPSGYWELSYTEDGNYHSRKVEHYEQIETLN